MKTYYDIAVVGAGIAGCTAAYTLAEAGADVVLLDKASSPATGGSGAAGAFISPRIGKGGALHTLTNEAYRYATRFYSERFKEYFVRSGLVRLPKDDEDALKFDIYEAANDVPYIRVDEAWLRTQGIMCDTTGFFFPDAGVCDAQGLCRALASNVTFVQLHVISLRREGEVWHIRDANGDGVTARSVVLATGFEQHLFDTRYTGIRGTWGSRGDYIVPSERFVSLHKTVSISASHNGVVKIGATHVKAAHPCAVCDGKPLASLEAKAAMIVDTSGWRLKETFCGMRSSARDYFPVLGELIDVDYMLREYPAVVRGAKVPLRHMQDVYLFNGMGGRGFVFAPLLAQWLVRRIVHKEAIDARVHPDRLFWKWVRKQKNDQKFCIKDI
jgi:tRNA 5-methylaminomethyl-2-thiouridine biosynthesis bifunctional protein